MQNQKVEEQLSDGETWARSLSHVDLAMQLQDKTLHHEIYNTLADEMERRTRYSIEIPRKAISEGDKDGKTVTPPSRSTVSVGSVRELQVGGASASTSTAREYQGEIGGVRLPKSTSPSPDDQVEGENQVKRKLPAQLYERLFADDRYSTIDGGVYKYNGKHYELVEDGKLKRAIAKLLYDAYPNNETPANVNSALEWLKMSTYANQSEVNAFGVCLANGILDIRINGNDVTWELTPHNPERIFTYVSTVEYDLDASNEHLNNLLQALDEPYSTIWLRTIAASLALTEVRKRHSRGIKALLMCGYGSNGKDTLMLPVERIFAGEGISRLSLQGMLSHDAGNNRFGVFQLLGAHINYANEAKKVDKLEDCSLFKCLVTGDAISVEQKFQQPFPYTPKCVTLFSTNDSPTMAAIGEAIRSRLAIIPFNKTFSRKPKPGQLKADARFHDDVNFIDEQLAPALLNRLLIELRNVIKHGINYDATEQVFEDNRYDNSHIYRIFYDAGFREVQSGSVTLTTLWNIYESECDKEGIDRTHRDRSDPDAPLADSRGLSKWLKAHYPSVSLQKGRTGQVVIGLSKEPENHRHIVTEKSGTLTEQGCDDTENIVTPPSPIVTSSQVEEQPKSPKLSASGKASTPKPAVQPNQSVTIGDDDVTVGVTIEPLPFKGCDDVTIKPDTLPSNSKPKPAAKKPTSSPYMIEERQFSKGDRALYTGKKYKELTGMELVVEECTSTMAFCKRLDGQPVGDWINLGYLTLV
jgi:P4 family phage/plasmid primase-like protien